MIVNQASLQGLNVAYSTAFNKVFQGVSTLYQEFATTVPSSTAAQNYKWLGQIPHMREWIGERQIQALSAYDYTIKNKKFEMSIAVPRDDIEDDQYGTYTPMFGRLGEAAALHPEELCFQALKDGFESLCYDGLPFFSDEHKSGDRIFSNLSHKKLSIEAFEEARAAIMSITGDQGKSLKLVPNLLIVSPKNEKMARLILEADQIEGTTNVNKGLAKVMVAPDLSDKPDKWFLAVTNRFIKPIIFQKRKEIKLTSYTKDDDMNVFLNDEFVWGADGRSNAGYSFWQMMYGSDGTAVEEAKG